MNNDPLNGCEADWWMISAAVQPRSFSTEGEM